ncbi:MAG: hypothetical protein GF344_19515 [Chitinivibrionales bacterium]|nr:hypothetical protein [Chitinivibrionales bacterium]MBD3358813.1 hypothetical protein [Chitinivibrionales bacterium]
MKSSTFCSAVVILTGLTLSCSTLAVRRYHGRKLGPIANEQVALEVATGLFIQCYGAEILREGPFTVSDGKRDKQPVWIVGGTKPADTRAGVPVIELTKKGGRVVFLGRER